MTKKFFNAAFLRLGVILVVEALFAFVEAILMFLFKIYFLRVS